MLLMAFCVSPVMAQHAPASTNHYEVLKQEKMFCVAGGFSGAVTPAGHSLMAMARQKDAATVFTKLTREESPTAQLFGLLGLKMIGSDRFHNALAKIAQDKSQVTVLDGCIAGQRPVATVAREIEQGRWSFGLPVQQAK